MENQKEVKIRHRHAKTLKNAQVDFSMLDSNIKDYAGKSRMSGKSIKRLEKKMRRIDAEARASLSEQPPEA